jgi:hypothetical protein
MTGRPDGFGVYDELVAALRARREALAISQAQLDEILGLTRGHVFSLEAKRKRTSAFLLLCWAWALGGRVTIEWEEGGDARAKDLAGRLQHRRSAKAAAASLRRVRGVRAVHRS